MKTWCVGAALLLAAAMPGLAADTLQDALAGARDFEHGQSRADLLVIEEALLAAHQNPARRALLEQQLLTLLDPATTTACKQFACEQIPRVATAASVPVLAALLDDPEARDAALYALAWIGPREATAALLAALGGSPDAEVVHALGTRRDEEAVPALTTLLAKSDPGLPALAVVRALGSIGGKGAAAALGGVLDEPRHASLRDEVAHALLACAARFEEEGKVNEARAIHERIYWGDHPVALRRAAIRGYIRTAPELSIAILLEVLWGNSPGMEPAVMDYLRALPGAGVAAAAHLANMPPELQVQVVDALADRGEAAVLPQLEACLSRPNLEVRRAAVRARARLGGEDELPRMVALVGEADLRDTAVAALSEMPGDGVNAALTGRLAKADAACAPALLSILAARRGAVDLAGIRPMLGSAIPEVRLAALSALGALGEPGDARTLALLMPSAPDAERTSIEAAVAEIAQRHGSDVVTELVAALLAPGVPPEKRVLLIGLLGRIGHDSAVGALARELHHPETAVSGAALEMLCRWPTGAAAPVLVALATRSDGATREAAFAGALRGLGLPHGHSAPAQLDMLGELLAVAKDGEARQAVYAALARVGDPRAMDLVKPLAADRALAEEATAALDAIRRGLYRATASHNTGTAANAIDGILSTQWSTAAPQLGTARFVLDLGLNYRVSGVTLDTTPSPQAYPAAVSLYLSQDGENWGDAVAEADGSDLVTLAFPAQRARYIMVRQTGQRPTQLWAIHEFTVDLETME